MDIYISHKSALEYWRLNRNTEITALSKLRRKSLPHSLPGSATIIDASPSGLSYPINIMVGNKNAKRKSRILRTRVNASTVPDGCFTSIGDGLAVSTPAFCFFQMAGELPLVKLIELGFEICGTYSLPVMSDYGKEFRHDHENPDENPHTLYGLPQLTDTKALKAFIARMKGMNGYKKACRALRYIANGSASPMETRLFMLLTLPHEQGGYELPAPVLNRRIDLSNSTDWRLRKSGYRCDLFWPDASLAIEYDSDTYHTGADRIARDSKRRFDLLMLGITVITITSRQLRNAVEFDGLARLIAGKLHKRLRFKNPQQFLKAKRELRGLLL